MADQVNKPSHYQILGEVEAIDVIKATLSEEEFRGYCLGNILKYRLRAGNKDDVIQELAKANKYKEIYESTKNLNY